MTNIDSIFKKQRHYFVDRGPESQSYGFSSRHVWTWELDYKESWVLKNWSFWTVVLEKTLGSSLDCKEIQPVHFKGNQSWIFFGRTDEGNGTPLQYSCLENPMDRGAWWAAVHGSLRVGHGWATSLSLFTFMHWRRKWQPTPVFLPGESQGRGSLVGCHLRGRTESDMTEVT